MAKPHGARPAILLFGAQGQVGSELVQSLETIGSVRALDRRGADLTDLAALRTTLREARADIVVNAAAYTAVDRAESEEGLAHRVNAEAPGVMAEEAARTGALLIHYSTDYVFDGTARRPYTERDATAPIGAYGRTKLAGEQAILASSAWAYIFRCAWIYARSGTNFLSTVTRLARDPEMRIVADQEGAPTWSRAIGDATARVVDRCWTERDARDALPARGVYHLAPPDHTSWHGVAEAIVAALPPRADGSRAKVRAITTEEFPTPARRPAWSVLDSTLMHTRFGVTLPPWREQLTQCLAQPADHD